MDSELRVKVVVIAVVLSISLCVVFAGIPTLLKEPREHIKGQSRAKLMNLLQSGSRKRANEALRMPKYIYFELLCALKCHGLLDGRNIGADHKLRIFLSILGDARTQASLAEEHGISPSRISQCFEEVLTAAEKLIPSQIYLRSDPECHPRISGSDKYYPYFKHLVLLSRPLILPPTPALCLYLPAN